MYFCIFIVAAFAVSGINAWGTPLHVSGDEINNASGTGTLEKLFRQKINQYTIVMFTGSRCGLSRGSKQLMDDNYRNQIYYYYDYDTSPMGVYFMHESTKAKNSSSTKLPHIWICGQYIGGLPELRELHSSGKLAAKLKQCPK